MIGSRDWENDWKIFKGLRLHEGAVIFLIVAAPWYIYMGIKHGVPFYAEFFGEHHFGRLEGSIKKPDGPFEFYIWQLAVGGFPWIAFLIPALFFTGMQKKRPKEETFTIFSFFFMFLFVSISATKFPHYIFPAVPFMAIIVSLPFIRFLRGERRAFFPLVAVFAALLIGVIAKDIGTGMNYREFLYIITTHRLQSWFGRVSDMLPYLRIFVPPMIFFTILPLIIKRRKRLMQSSAVLFFITVTLFAGYINFYFVPGVLEVFSPEKLIDKYKAERKEGDILIDYHNWKNRSMYFYMGLENEFTSTNSADRVVDLIRKNPDKTVYLTVKNTKVAELRSIVMNKLGVPFAKVTDDRVGTYMEIELYKTSMNDKSLDDGSWKKDIITESQIPRNLKKLGGTSGNGMLEYVGYTINKNRFDQGEEIELTMYYKVMKEIPKSYMIFFHMEVAEGALPRTMKLDDYPFGGFYPTNRWKPGEIIRQKFTKKISSNHPGGGIKIFAGFFKGRERLPVDQEKFNDGEDRFMVGMFRINFK